jgi:signal transduction histidine kinase
MPPQHISVPGRLEAPGIQAEISARFSRSSWLVAAAAGAAMAAWALLGLLSSRVQLTFTDPGHVYAERRIIGIAFLMVALMLLALANATPASRLRWMALSFVILTAGSVLFGDLFQQRITGFSLNTGLYGALLTRAFLIALLAVGFLFPQLPFLSARRATVITGGFLALATTVSAMAHTLPPLATVDALPPEPAAGFMSGLTPLYWSLSISLIVLATAVAVVAARRSRTWGLGAWIGLAATLNAGLMLHFALRPSMFGISTEVTTSNMLTLALVLVIILGIMRDLRSIAGRIAIDRDARAEQVRRLEDFSRLRADFTIMVAHELAQPLLAIQRHAELLDTATLDPEERASVHAIAAEAAALSTLIGDVHASARAETDDFTVVPETADLSRMLERAASYAKTLAGNHPIRLELRTQGEVWADPDRIDQVLRNLLGNAARYTERGSPLTLRILPLTRSYVRIEVEDEGSGIEPDALMRVFRKFGRGETTEPGLGLGLYLSQRILRSSGSDLHYRRGEGGGSCFWFELPRVAGNTADIPCADRRSPSLADAARRIAQPAT